MQHAVTNNNTAIHHRSWDSGETYLLADQSIRAVVDKLAEGECVRRQRAAMDASRIDGSDAVAV